MLSSNSLPYPLIAISANGTGNWENKLHFDFNFLLKLNVFYSNFVEKHNFRIA